MAVFEARIYKPDDDERYMEYTLTADNREAALQILTDPADGVYFPDLGDRLLDLIEFDVDDDEDHPTTVGNAIQCGN